MNTIIIPSEQEANMFLDNLGALREAASFIDGFRYCRNSIEVINKDLPLRTIAEYRGIDYDVFGMGKHRISFLIEDGASDFKCTYRKRK